ncbi:MAG: Smr/MutS family protein [Blastocatellia bacterium]|nr:Smr/MutS family protein [Blastocatellia bacterium]
MPVQSLQTLEFPALVELLAKETQSIGGRRRALALVPSDDANWIAAQLTLTTETRRFLTEIGSLSVGDLPDVSETLGQLRIAGTRLEPEELQELLRLMRTGTTLRDTFRPAQDEFPALRQVFERVPNLTKTYQSVRRVLLPTGEIDENASPELRRIRHDIQNQRGRIQNQLETLMRRSEMDQTFSDQVITQRNGRFVVPVRNDHRGHVPGVVHAMSSSGVTAFVEPLATIELNNEMVRLQELEQAEIARILFKVTEALRQDFPALEQLAETLSEVDFLVAKARFANNFRCIEPSLNTIGDFHLREARHPLLEANLRKGGGAIVPIGFTLSANERVMVISGPNAGGKTVVLKTAGLCALMAQSGLHVPAREANLCVFRQIQAEIGDHQSLAANLSTFSSHITNLKRISEELATPALVLIDEVGTGTDPDEGAALGVAVTDYFRQQGTHTIVSTHYNPLKIYADTTPGVLNSAVEFDTETLRPTYRLLVRQAGTSSGLEIARKLGLVEDILQAAHSRLGSREADMTRYLDKLKGELDYHHDLNIALEEERAVLAERYAKLDHQFAEREQARQKIFSETLHELRDEFFSQVRPLLERISSLTEQQKLQKEAERAVKKLVTTASERQRSNAALRLVKEPVPPPAETKGTFGLEEKHDASPLRVGDRVQTELGQEGTVEEVGQDMLLVRVGSMRLKTAARHVTRMAGAEAPKPKTHKVETSGPTVVTTSGDVLDEINLIGCTADEAIMRTDKFLDEAVMSHLSRVRIIHGMGMGILRREIDSLLTGHPHVSKFYRASSNEGGNGATVVELRL